MKKWMLALIFMGIGIAILPALAQDDNTLEYGDRITGGMPATGEAATYTFEGEAGDIVLISVELFSTKYPYVPTETYNRDGVDVELIDPNGDVIVEPDAEGILVAAALKVVILPADGTYTLNISPSDTNSIFKADVDQFTLTLTKSTPLRPGDLISASYEGESQFYVVQTQTDTLAVTIDYGGETQNVMVSISPNDHLRRSTNLKGKMTKGTITLKVDPQVFYLITVNTFESDPEPVVYELSIR